MSSKLEILVDDLTSDDTAKQAAAAEELARSGKGARPGAVALVRALRSENSAVREWCVAALEGIGPPPSDQIEELVCLARDESHDTGYWAITLLGRAGAGAAVAVPQLIEVLTDGSAKTANRERAAWALGKIGPAAAPAIPALRKAAESGPPRLGRLANVAQDEITR